MHESLQPGLSNEFAFLVPPTKTVPSLYPDSGARNQRVARGE